MLGQHPVWADTDQEEPTPTGRWVWGRGSAPVGRSPPPWPTHSPDKGQTSGTLAGRWPLLAAFWSCWGWGPGAACVLPCSPPPGLPVQNLPGSCTPRGHTEARENHPGPAHPPYPKDSLWQAGCLDGPPASSTGVPGTSLPSLTPSPQPVAGTPSTGPSPCAQWAPQTHRSRSQPPDRLLHPLPAATLGAASP